MRINVCTPLSVIFVAGPTFRVLGETLNQKQANINSKFVFAFFPKTLI